MDVVIINSPEKRINSEVCGHYWLIGTPNGATCKGICKFCGEEKEFISSFQSLIDMKIKKNTPVEKDIPEDNIEVEDDGLFKGA
ncbi:hypothetical protein ACFLW6_04205 [Chloroflexota bacterium]